MRTLMYGGRIRAGRLLWVAITPGYALLQARRQAEAAHRAQSARQWSGCSGRL